MEPPEDELLRAYGTLVSLRKNVPEDLIPEGWGKQVDGTLKRIGNELGIDLSEFFIPDDYYFYPRAVSFTNSDKVIYHEYRLLHSKLFLAKFDAAINYINLRMPSEPVSRMGFK